MAAPRILILDNEITLARSSDGHDDKCLFIVDKPVGKERG